MTRRRGLERHRHSLNEIREITNSMKTLAFMETRKLSRFLDAQHAVVKSIETAAHDLIGFSPVTLPAYQADISVYIVIGTERGFCGDFNHRLVDKLADELALIANKFIVFSVGRKLNTLLEADSRVNNFFDGASVAEEVTTTLNLLINQLANIQKAGKLIDVYCVFHHERKGLTAQKILPPFQNTQQIKKQTAIAPELNIESHQLLVDVAEQYFFAVLYETLYSSLMQENLQRMSHLESAVRHLDEDLENLTRQSNILRQEEIVEEIEVILLSADSQADTGSKNIRD